MITDEELDKLCDKFYQQKQPLATDEIDTLLKIIRQQHNLILNWYAAFIALADMHEDAKQDIAIILRRYLFGDATNAEIHAVIHLLRSYRGTDIDTLVSELGLLGFD